MDPHHRSRARWAFAASRGGTGRGSPADATERFLCHRPVERARDLLPELLGASGDDYEGSRHALIQHREISDVERGGEEMSALLRSVKHARYAMGSLTAVLFA